MTALSQRSVAAQLRLLGVAMLVLFPLLAASTLVNLGVQARNVRALTLTLGPALEADTTVLLDMTEASGAWSEQVHGGTPAKDYRLQRGTVDAELTDIDHAIAQGWISADLQRRYRALNAKQRTEVGDWFTLAERAEEAGGRTPAARSPLEASATAAFSRFRVTNRALYDDLRDQRDQARTGSRTSIAAVAWWWR